MGLKPNNHPLADENTFGKIYFKFKGCNLGYQQGSVVKNILDQHRRSSSPVILQIKFISLCCETGPELETNESNHLLGEIFSMFPSLENKEKKSLLETVMASEKDLYRINGQAWQKEGDRGSVTLWGLSAMHKSPTWKSHKDWHYLWPHAMD